MWVLHANMDYSWKWSDLPTAPSLKHLTEEGFGRPKAKQHEAVQHLVKAHIESFNQALTDGLCRVVQVSALRQGSRGAGPSTLLTYSSSLSPSSCLSRCTIQCSYCIILKGQWMGITVAHWFSTLQAFSFLCCNTPDLTLIVLDWCGCVIAGKTLKSSVISQDQVYLYSPA